MIAPYYTDAGRPDRWAQALDAAKEIETETWVHDDVRLEIMAHAINDMEHFLKTGQPDIGASMKWPRAPRLEPRAEELPEVIAFKAAEAARIAAVHAYNAALEEAHRKDQVKGFGHTNINAEYQAMTAAANHAFSLVRPMLDAILGR